VQLNPISDATSYIWKSGGVSVSTLKRPSFKPNETTTYNVIANIGKCQASDSINVFAFPYPKSNINKDTILCFGDATQLSVSGGIKYLWMPAAGLNNNRIANPIAKPTTTTRYKVSIFNDFGCLKPTNDTVVVTVIPKVKAFAGNDTSIVLNQPLQLNAFGGNFYQWSPSLGLSDTNIRNPIATLSSDYRYYLRVSTPEGCAAIDTINIHVFQTNPDIFVPTAFTPNNDQLNDLLIPIPVGIATFDYFKVYNRFGELIFSTIENGKGWDGKINGKEQGIGTFTWFVQGKDYTGKRVFKKGTSILLK
jgi:gliding motility-associated-like protein